MVPRVAMNGGSWNFPTRIPFTTPMARQQTSVISMAAMGLTPWVIRVAAIMALMPTTEPMDKSMLPVMST